jgi:hypothetical protein
VDTTESVSELWNVAALPQEGHDTEWERLQEQAEGLAARYLATERVYSRSVYEP